MARILILYASGGEGHKSAARALCQAFEMRGVEAVRMEDALDHGSPLYRQLYLSFYHELSENAPSLWEYAYKLTDKADENDTQFVNNLRMMLDRLGVTELDELVEHFAPDVIVCTHFLATPILTRQRLKGKIPPVPVYVVVTDYTANAKWVAPGVDGYFVATPKTREMLIYRGAPDSLINITGIPVDPLLAEPKDRMQVRQQHNISQEPVITMIGSALHVERVHEMITGLLDSGMRGTLIVVAGRNEELKDGIAELQSNDTLTLWKLGFVDFLDDLITGSDLVITKAGGLIVSEIMARGTPMVVIDPIPGQEHWNADYIVSVGAGVQVRLAEMIPSVVKSLLDDPERLELMREKSSEAGRPSAAFTVADSVLEVVQRERVTQA